MWTREETTEAWELLEAALLVNVLPTSKAGFVRVEIPVEEFGIAERTSDAGYHFVHISTGSHLWVYRVDIVGQGQRGDIHYEPKLFGGVFDAAE